MEDSVPREYFPWDVEITDDLNSLWLPTSEYVSSIDAGDEWRFDSETLDVSAARSGVDTRDMDYSLESLVPDFDAQAMAEAGAAPVDIAVKYTELPTDFPDSVAELADSLTADQPSDYEKAVRAAAVVPQRRRLPVHHHAGSGQRHRRPAGLPRRQGGLLRAVRDRVRRDGA